MGRSFKIKVTIVLQIVYFFFLNFLVRIYTLFSLNKCKGILIVKIDALGDAVLFSGILEHLQNEFNNVHLVCSEGTKEYYELIGVRNIIPVNYNKLRSLRLSDLVYKINILSKIRRNHYDIVAQFRYTRSLGGEDLIVSTSRSDLKIGMKGECEFGFINCYDKLIEINKNLHDLEKNFYFLTIISCKHFKLEIPNVGVYFNNDNIINKPYFVIFPGASEGIRRWAIENFIEVANYIIEKTSLIPVVCGNSKEADLANIINRSVDIINLSGKTSLPEFFSIIKNARFVITNDTSAVHIAAATQTKSICITGGGQFRRFLPYPSAINNDFMPIIVNNYMDCYNCNWNCKFVKGIDSTAPCISNIKKQSVLDAIDNLFSC